MDVPSKMIKVVKSFRRDDMLFTISTYINEKTVGISDEEHRDRIEKDLKNRIVAIEKDVNNKNNVMKFKDYLLREVFKHFVDVKTVHDYVDDVVDILKSATKSIDHKGLVLLFYY